MQQHRLTLIERQQHIFTAPLQPADNPSLKAAGKPVRQGPAQIGAALAALPGRIALERDPEAASRPVRPGVTDGGGNAGRQPPRAGELLQGEGALAGGGDAALARAPPPVRVRART